MLNKKQKAKVHVNAISVKEINTKQFVKRCSVSITQRKLNIVLVLNFNCNSNSQSELFALILHECLDAHMTGRHKSCEINGLLSTAANQSKGCKSRCDVELNK